MAAAKSSGRPLSTKSYHLRSIPTTPTPEATGLILHSETVCEAHQLLSSE